MDWLICIGAGLGLAVTFAIISVFSSWYEDAVKGGAVKRKNW